MAERQGEGSRRTRPGRCDLTRILALGDSYTAGEGVAPEHAWPHIVAARLAAAGGPIEWETIARTGWTAAELLAAIAAEAPVGPYRAVTVGAGVNDQYRCLPIEGFRRDIGRLHDTAVRLAGGDPRRVLALSIPDWSVTPFAAGRDRGGIARQIDAFNEAAAGSAAARAIGWLDLTAASREAAGHPALVAADGLHPSESLHAIWAEAIAGWIASGTGFPEV